MNALLETNWVGPLWKVPSSLRRLSDSTLKMLQGDSNVRWWLDWRSSLPSLTYVKTMLPGWGVSPQREEILKIKRNSSHPDNPLTTGREGFTLRQQSGIQCLLPSKLGLIISKRRLYFWNVQTQYSIMKSNGRNFKKHRFMWEVP